MAVKITFEGDDLDELKTQMQAFLDGTGEPAAEEEAPTRGKRNKKNNADEDAGDADDLLGGDDDETPPEEDDAEEKRKTILAALVKILKAAGGPDKVKAALSKVKAKKFNDIADEKLDTFAKLLKIKVD